MKNIHRSLKLLCLSLIFIFSACNTTDLDLTQNPNQLRPDEASADFFINSIQVDFGILIASIEVEASETVRILNMDGRNYQQAFEPTRFDNEWTEAYQQILNDVRSLTPIATEANQFYHLGMAQVLEAYILISLVDLFGDVPFSEAALGAENLNPSPDPGRAIYDAAIALLDAAIVNFERDDVILEPTQDLFYNGDWENWAKAANSIKMKIYVTTRLVDPNAATNFNAIVASGNFINEASEDFQFPWGVSNNNPDDRHPNYVSDYTPSGANTYMSNWLMGYMQNNKVGNGLAGFETADPRMKYYFYRQTDFVPQDQPNLINCVAETAPDHYTPSDVFCSLPQGYWGRDHGDNAGIPPDGQTRTTFGVYPAGGRFDDNTFAPITSISLGAGGAGITPIILSSWTDIMQAEMALEAGDIAGAQASLLAGVAKSFSKVRSFGSLDGNADLTTAPDSDLDEDYITELGALFNAGSTAERWDLLGAEYFVALFGNGLDGFNFYRRTGRPSSLQPNLEPNPGAFFRSFFYPPVFVERNASTSQKSGVTDQVFWDTGVTLLAN